MNRSAWEKLHGATLSLARSGALKDRITAAYRNHLALLEESELPKELRDRFRALSRTLTRERPLVRGDDAFRATIRKMSNDEAEDVSMEIVGLFAAVQQRGAVLVTPSRVAMSAQVVPLYIADTRLAESLAVEA